MARGKKRNRSLLELMDPQKDYRPSVGSAGTEGAAEAAEQDEQDALAQIVVEPVVESTSKEPVEPAVSKPPKVVVAAAIKKEPTEPAGAEGSAEPMVTFGQGKVRVALNYPLAMMIGFMVVVIVICAVLVGWKVGRDRAAGDSRPRVEGWLPVMGPSGLSGGSD